MYMYCQHPAACDTQRSSLILKAWLNNMTIIVVASIEHAIRSDNSWRAARYN